MGKFKFIWLVFVWVLGGMALSHAADFRLINSQFIRVSTNSFSLSATNGVTVTNTIDVASDVYHTFQLVYSATGTNNTSVITDRTIDSANYYPVQTNVMTTTSTNVEQTATGKWVTYRFRATFANTNAPTVTVNYIGQ